jgi:hypothetical protein
MGIFREGRTLNLKDLSPRAGDRLTMRGLPPPYTIRTAEVNGSSHALDRECVQELSPETRVYLRI